MRILCLNCGSSSVKYRLFDWDKQLPLATGGVERVTVGGSFIVHEANGRPKLTVNRECPDHRMAIQLVMDTLTHADYGVIPDTKSIAAVGHRGGARRREVRQVGAHRCGGARRFSKDLRPGAPA